MQTVQSCDAVQNSIRASEPIEDASTIDGDKDVSIFTDEVGGAPSTAATSEESHEAEKTADADSKNRRSNQREMTNRASRPPFSWDQAS